MYSCVKTKAPERQRQKAQKRAREPQERYCPLVQKKVTVLIEYPDYRNYRDKGHPGDLYCSNLIECYNNREECRYSGISPLYPDPFNIN